MLSLGGMVANTDTINAAVRGGDVVGAMAVSNPTFGAIYGLSKMDSPTDFTPLINGGIRATSIANAYGQDLAIQQGAPLLGNNFENTKNALSGGPSVSIGFGTHKSETTWTESYISQFNMGSGSMTIKSGRDINLVGTQIQAEGITLDAGQKLNILADADYYKNRSSGAGVSVSYGASGWGFGVSGNKSKTDSTTYTNAGLNAGNGTLLLKSGAEMNIIGANLDGKFIDVDAKGLLTVASVQNTSHSKNSSFGVNVNQSNAASMNGSRGSSDRTFTDNLTTILGAEGVRIHSDTGTVVEGALIANATKNADGTLTDHGNLKIETPFLSWKDLEDIDVSKQIGGGINVSGDDGRNTSGTKTFSDVWDDTANADYRKDETIGVTKATIGNGTITITDPTKQTQDIKDLNRDINNVQIITKESETHISITVPLPDAIANPIGNAGGAVANGIVDAASAVHSAVAGAVEKLSQVNALSESEKAELIEKVVGCNAGGSASVTDWFISSAYADVAYDCSFQVGKHDIKVTVKPDGTKVIELQNDLGADILANAQFQTGAQVGVCLGNSECFNAQVIEPLEGMANGVMVMTGIGAVASLVKVGWTIVRQEGGKALLVATTDATKAMVVNTAKAAKSLASGTKTVETTIQFGRVENQVYHTFRHVEAAGLDRAVVSGAIRSDLSSMAANMQNGLYNGRVVINGIQVEYAAYKLPSGVINVGRITVPRP